MKGRSHLGAAALLALLLVVPGIAVPPFGPAPAVASALRLDPLLRAHPYLQYGAWAQPDRRARMIVQKTSALVDAAAIARILGVAVLEEFPFIDGFVIEAPLAVVGWLAGLPGVRYVTYDAPIRTDALDATRLRTTHLGALGVPQLWRAAPGPTTGAGVTVAVLDSGVDAAHPDLRGRVTARSVTGADSGDSHGHGTHVIGLLAGRDPQGRYLGAAPDATVISVKIADERGVGSESALIRGLQWVHEHRAAAGIRVVNLSVSAAMPTSPVVSPVAAAVERLWRDGVVVVASAGNRGDAPDAAWYPPGNDPFVISVGALDHQETVAAADDRLAPFSGRGVTQEGRAKPELVAPGRRLVAPLASGGAMIAGLYPDRVVDSGYIRLSGTSMSAPLVAGAAALLLARHPALTPDQVKWLLLETADAYAGQPGPAGVVDPAGALRRAASAPVGVANQGLTPSVRLPVPTLLTVWDQGYWDQGYWDQGYWDQGYWDQVGPD